MPTSRLYRRCTCFSTSCTSPNCTERYVLRQLDSKQFQTSSDLLRYLMSLRPTPGFLGTCTGVQGPKSAVCLDQWQHRERHKSCSKRLDASTGAYTHTIKSTEGFANEYNPAFRNMSIWAVLYAATALAQRKWQKNEQQAWEDVQMTFISVCHIAGWP